MAATTTALWQDLTTRCHDLKQIEFLQGMVGWDQQTYMPSQGGSSRAEHMAYLHKLSHAQLCHPDLGDCIDRLGERLNELDEHQQAGLRNLRRARQREVSVPAELAERLGRLHSKGFEAWLGAREASDFSVLEPVLTEIVAATRERADAIRQGADPYAAMLDEYDPGVDPDALTDIFTRLRAGLAPLIDGVRGADAVPALGETYDEAGQLRLAHRVAEALGYDLAQGRIDQAQHPFTVTLGGSDVRFTIKLEPENVLDMLGGTIHETGHALYEQGLPRDRVGVSDAASMGLHESQSRFWENVIGRSRPFLSWLRGPFAEVFGGAPELDRLYASANRVEPGAIRVAADEVTYNLHVGIRYDLERALFAADSPLEVRDLPEAWNAAYARDLGVQITDPKDGILQDVHWPSGAFGYFPSYTLGNLYAASFARTLESDLPEMWRDVERGHFAGIVDWLRDHIHHHGHLWEAPELVQRVTGERDAVQDLLTHFWARHGTLYGLTPTKKLS